MRYITDAKYINGFCFEVEFNEGIVKKVDLKNYLDGEIFQPLHNIDYFKKGKFSIELDTIVWENGADFSPEFLYEIGKDIAAVSKAV